ncbi:MAG: 16S rRNA (uracil(1498)-N(3))-methyltransferase [Verrucomicrobia bacterium]|nr:16S rRNA (uracil(1498)-N(3))-methyltransferase [Verrucomicrobiota bacterium]
MPVDRFYLNQDLIQEDLIFLKEDEFHHLAHVLRVKEGETIEILNGKGSLASAKVEKIEKHQARLSILSSNQSPKPSYELILAQAIPRQPRLEYILEKSVELGATQIWLFPGELSEKKTLSSSGLERAHHILISAMKQCGRLFIPSLSLSPPISSWDPSSLPKSSFFGDTNPDAKSFLSCLKAETINSCCIVIGPEKGFHAKEISHLKSLEIRGVHLHSNILRTDTAAICSLSLASSFIFPLNPT